MSCYQKQDEQTLHFLECPQTTGSSYSPALKFYTLSERAVLHKKPMFSCWMLPFWHHLVVSFVTIGILLYLVLIIIILDKKKLINKKMGLEFKQVHDEKVVFFFFNQMFSLTY